MKILTSKDKAKVLRWARKHHRSVLWRRPKMQDSAETLNGGSLHRIVVLLRELEEEERKMEKAQKAAWGQAGEQMRDARKEAQLSVREAAKRLGISAPFLSDMELGRRKPSIKWVEKLSQLIKQHND